jgi:hypothetical protein
LKIWDVMRSTDFSYSDKPHGYLREFIGLPNAAKLARYARLLRSGSPPLRVQVMLTTLSAGCLRRSPQAPRRAA